MSATHYPDAASQPKSYFLRGVILTFLAVTLVSFVASAQQGSPEGAKRPKVGLVLEGGSALGLAHIGVLQWLEEHHIPISYVAGTSMGGLVGGVYATGKSPSDIRNLINGIDWHEVLRGETPYRNLSFRRKQDKQEYPNSLEFGLKHGIQFPEGFNSGQQVSLLFDEIAAPYVGIKSFDDLPIPFACVATDLVSKKEYVFRDGPLAQALRSTMSLPGIFTPVRTGDHIFVDGGLLDNLPVDVAQQMGAELIVAVHLQTKELDPRESISSFAVLGRSINVVISANELRSMEKADVLITVPLADFSSLDYQKVDAITKAGYAAAESKASVLSALSVDEASWNRYLAQRDARRRTTLPATQFVEVTGASPQTTREIQAQLSGTIGKPLDIAELDQQLTNLTGIGRFSRVGYRIIEQDGKTGMQIVAEEKPYAPPTVLPIIVIDGSDYNNVLYSMGARITFFDLGGFGRELRNDLTLGSEYALRSEYFVPLRSGSPWFVAPHGFADSTPFPAYEGDQFVAQYRKRKFGGGADLGYEFGRKAEIRFGYEVYYLQLYPQIGNPHLLPSANGRVGDSRFRYVLNDLDDPVVPRNGVGWQLNGDWYDTAPRAGQAFATAETRFEGFKRISNPSSVYLIASGGTTFGFTKTGLPAFSVGASKGLAAYGTNELLTNQYFLFQLGYLTQLLTLPPFLGDKLYFVSSFEMGKAYKLPMSFTSPPPLSSRLPLDGVAGVIVKTIFGPVLVAGSVGDTGHHRFFFQVGKVF